MIRSVFSLQTHSSDTSADAVTAVSVTGEIDVNNAEDFAQSVAALARPGPVILDLSGLRYLDSAGFAALDRLLANRTVVVVLTSASPIHKAALLMELPFDDDIDAARQSLSAS